jgi:D-glycero-D-manno-heptose 1,7-bisphosphate phosphatase
MALQAREDFPHIDFHKSVIVGNSMSDMEFGKRLAMHTVFLTTKHEPYELPHDLIDEQFPSLQDWTRSLMPAMMLEA